MKGNPGPTVGRLSPNKRMLRAGMHKVLGRGRGRPVLEQVMRARVLLTQRTGADVGRSATLLRPLAIC